jgi:CRISPR/Cas system-associated endonuclease Cas1
MKRVLRVIDHKLGQIQSQEERCRKREAAEEQARQAVAVLPSPDVLDKIMRYETKLERQMYRAMNQLERVQRMRRGEAVPPPLTMEVSERL